MGSSSARGGFAVVTAAEYASINPTVTVYYQEPERIRRRASIQVGALKTANDHDGAPESKVTIPDDNTRCRSASHWSIKGKQLGTVRLDNGRMVNAVRTDSKPEPIGPQFWYINPARSNLRHRNWPVPPHFILSCPLHLG